MMRLYTWPRLHALALCCFMTALLLSSVPAQEQRTIANPFYKNPEWHLWYENPTPVVVKAGQKTYKAAPVPVEERRYPVFTDEWIKSASGAPPLKKLDDPGNTAGSWDDAFMSLDNMHSGGNFGKRSGDVMHAGKLTYEYAPKILQQLGVNFSSQSYAMRGRYIVDDTQTLLFTEKNYTFANIVRGTPSHASYEDKDPKIVNDKYDGLFAHAYHSLGQSGSEVYGLEKMMIAGACMDRDVKNTLKKHGLYALTLLTIFKQALPCADTSGRPLPYQHELRHRPAYSSSGNLGHPHYAPANPYYHAYNDDLHLYSMCRLAQAMKTVPPVALIGIQDIKLENSDRATSATEALVSRSLTSARVWAKPGETIRIRVDLRNCYTIDNSPFQVHGDVLYPEQKNISLTTKEHGIIEVVASHDPKLPKHRQTVIFFASGNSPVPSNPVFLNIYWPEKGEVANWPMSRLRKNEGHIREGMKIPVTNNLRPQLLDMQTDTTILATPGETITLPLDASDPEGYPVAIYRWLGEQGAIENNTFTFTCPDDSADKIFPFHFIFSDQTGAYNGMRLKVLVSKEKSTLTETWQQTVLGSSVNPGHAQIDDDKITLTGQGKDENDGAYVFKPVSGDFDVTCPLMQFETGNGENAWGIMMRENLKDFSRLAAVEIVQNGKDTSARFRVRPNYSRWSRSKTPSILIKSPRYLRLVRRNNLFASYTSEDQKNWEYLGSSEIKIPDEALLGILVRGQQEATIHTTAPVSADSAFPIIKYEGKAVRHKTRRWTGELKVSLLDPDAARFTLIVDGSEHTGDEPVTLSTPGEYPITVRIKSGPNAGQIIQTRVVVEPKKEEKE